MPLIIDRVMVCMSSHAHAPRVVQTGAQIAGRLGARWYAVYVERPDRHRGRATAGAPEALRRNIELAERLGATVVRVKASRPADGLIAFAEREGITHAIFGASTRRRWERLWRASTIDRFRFAIHDAAIQIVPLDEHS